MEAEGGSAGSLPGSVPCGHEALTIVSKERMIRTLTQRKAALEGEVESAYKQARKLGILRGRYVRDSHRQ